MKKILITLSFLLLLLPVTAMAQDTAPATDELTPAQQETAQAILKGICEGRADAGVELSPECEQFTYVPPVKEYTIPVLPQPDGVPGISASDLSDPEVARQYFLKTVLPSITKLLIGLIALASFLVLLYAGAMYFTTLGDEDKATKAKNAALYSIVGLIVALLSFAIVQIISSLPFK
ncbi:hypothetical protein COV81_02755 [Candidatus Peregrinibacteria bacterium CG11_big_fil_rev_8_21_14_0_20_41_10]|nr:MAG: hypothetical protein COV81_02755 [Candidatus Peregrinibacteria bacterium CG11_big_fil_rev_8_21_14_0_20_41_10]PIZ76576.1 MAG: hypothetical protein COY06_01760 [Candidatus Peregrinibacteria bacterium CG_4_10_14_0_2_um_filter_41_8]PJC37662.1 MAG: hypothetical protein CO045_04170 [Candidatus Peregrinibacteria bacterium CG_4_9_14_0_2_um_filter_41_14]